MDDYLSEKEQIEKMQAWWSEYGNYVIAGVVLGAVLLFGGNYYRNSVQQTRLEASELYASLTDDVVEERIDQAEAKAGQLYSEYADTPYATQARLAMARLYLDRNRDQDAAETLEELIASDTEPAFRDLARLRLAKILLYQDKAEAVIDLLDGAEEDGAFAARFAEVLGDAYTALQRYTDAAAAYQRALAEPSQAATVDQTFVQLKLLDLPVDATGGVPAEAEPDEGSG